jgi:hypothetical protein
MNTRNQLLDIVSLLNKAQGLLKMIAESQPKPPPGKPPQPYWTQRTKKEIWDFWDKIKTKDTFTAADVWDIVHPNSKALTYRIDSFYSAILSEWARDGHLEIVRKGRGQTATFYKIPR